VGPPAAYAPLSHAEMLDEMWFQMSISRCSRSPAKAKSLSAINTRTSISNAQELPQHWRPGDAMPFLRRCLTLGNLDIHSVIAQRCCCLISFPPGSPTQAGFVSFGAAQQRFSPSASQSWLLSKCKPTRALPTPQALLTTEHESTPLERQLVPPPTLWTWHEWADRKSCGGTSSLYPSLG
jgi:hypothetical protein